MTGNSEKGGLIYDNSTTATGSELNKLLLFSLFFVLYFADTLGLNLSLAPGLSVKNAILYLLLLALLVQTAIMRHRRIELVSVFVPLAFFAAYAILMWLVALLVLDYPNYSLRASLFSLKGGPIDDLVVIFVFAFGIASARQAIWVLRGMVWIVILGNIITVLEGLEILNLGLIGAKIDGRVLGPIGNSNQYGYILAIFIPMTVAMFYADRGVKRGLAGIGVVTSLIAFFMAVSRGSIVGLVLAGIMGTFLLRREISTRTAMSVAVGLLIITFVALAAASIGGYTDMLVARFEQFGEGRQRASSGRLIFWGTLVNRMLEDPLSFASGFGWYAYETFQANNRFGHSPHSTYLSILFNLGLVGLLCYLAAVVNIFRTSILAAKQASQELRPWIFGFVFGFLALVVGLTFNDLVSASIYVWSLAGICLRIAAEAIRVNEVAIGGSGRRARPTPFRVSALPQTARASPKEK